VLTDWSFAPVAGERGLTALFAGESGTGKTMASRVIGAAVGLDVYRIDLAGLFSKWVGETEKNLDRIFRTAHGANAVLLFDEADVVFGKRTEASDSGDRYANLETAYLLQRIERYDGVVVLATNLLRNMDEAFVRRLDVVVDFPPPQADTRRRLWRALLPDEAPVGDDVDLDFLADRFELTGGGIRNCTLAAAFLAAEDGTSIGMSHVIRAVALEYAKLGRLTVEADFDRFHALVTGQGDAAKRLNPS
jgi:SpoVK/Ycf46/Vps4 family AAA+-type ATPase